MMLSCMSGCADPSGVRELPRVIQLSPTRPTSKSSSPASRTSRSSTSGRRTINSRVPSSLGARRISSNPPSSSAVVKCLAINSSLLLLIKHSGLFFSLRLTGFVHRETSDQLIGLVLCKELVGFGLRFFGALFLQLLINTPRVAERVDDLSVTRAPEHVLQGHDHARARGDCACDHRVGIIGLQGDAHTGSTQRLGHLAHAAFTRRELVRDEKLMAVQNDLAVQKAFAVLRHHVVAYFRAECVLVELKRGDAVADDQMGNELVFAIHGGYSFLGKQHTRLTTKLRNALPACRPDLLTYLLGRSFWSCRAYCR